MHIVSQHFILMGISRVLEKVEGRSVRPKAEPRWVDTHDWHGLFQTYDFL